MPNHGIIVKLAFKNHAAKMGIKTNEGCFLLVARKLENKKHLQRFVSPRKISELFVIFGGKLVEIGRWPYSGEGIKKAPNSLKFGAFVLRSL